MSSSRSRRGGIRGVRGKWRRPDHAYPFDDSHIRLPDGRRMAYAQFGDPDGRAIFWFPGTPGARTQVPPSAPEIGREKGFRIIGVDRPGFGGSSPHRRRTLTSYASDIGHLADRLGLDQFACVGLSGGGPYVLSCAYNHAKRMVAGVSLGGVGPLHPSDCRGPDAAPGIPRHLYAAARVVSRLRSPVALWGGVAIQAARPFAGAAYDLYVNLGPTHGDQEVMRRPELKNMFIEDALMGIRRGIRGPVWDISLFSRPWPFRPADIRIPIRFWHGDVDPVVPLSHSEHLAGVIPDADLTVVSGLGHFAGFASAPAVLEQLDALWPSK